MHESKYYLIELFHDNLKKIKNHYTILINDNSNGVKDSRINLRDSLQNIRKIFIKNDHTHMLIVEADIFPKENIIDELLKYDKDVVSALYQIDKKKGIFNAYHNFLVANNKTFSNLFIGPNFLDGELKEINGAGLGCVLIKREVLEKIEFRCGQWSPDMYFWQDLKAYGFKGYVDTSIIVKHYPNGASSIEKR